jgi:hypothetical protein
MGGRALEALLSAGEAVPFVGKVCILLHRLKKYVDDFHDSEEECRRLSVWCLGMMGSFSRLATESTQVDDGMTSLLQAAGISVKELCELVMARRNSSEGVAGRAHNFWTTGTYLEKAESAKDKIQKALDALMLRVAAETRLDVQKVLQRTDRLPAMDEKLGVVLQGLGVIEADFPELDEPTLGIAAGVGSIFPELHEPPAYSLSSQLTLSPSTEDVRTPQVRGAHRAERSTSAPITFRASS